MGAGHYLMIIIFRGTPPPPAPNPPPWLHVFFLLFVFLFVCSGKISRVLKEADWVSVQQIKQHLLKDLISSVFTLNWGSGPAYLTGLSGIRRNLILCMFTQECLIINRHSHYWNYHRNKTKVKTEENIQAIRLFQQIPNDQRQQQNIFLWRMSNVNC